MGRCIVHVGMHNTGTSSIQQSLKGFSDGTFLYADIDGHSNHGGPVLQMLDCGLEGGRALHGAAGPGGDRPPGSALDALARVERSIREAGERTLLMSGVAIGVLPQEAVARLHAFLSSRFSEVIAVAAVRAPAGYMGSAFQERIKRGASNSLDTARQYRKYRRSFEKFDQVFGRENVRLWKYDPAAFPGGCAVRDFCDRLQIDLPAERIVRVNESLSGEALGLLFTYRKLGGELGSMSMSGPQNARLVRRLMGLGGTRFRFSPAVMRPLLENNRADIEWMQERLGQSLHEELGEHRPGDVRDEADLLRADPAALAQLRALLGERAPAGVRGESPLEVAMLVHALREGDSPHEGTAAKPPAARPGPTRMNAAALIEQLRRQHPELLEGIAERDAVVLLQRVLRHINVTLGQMEEGVLGYADLGSFRVRQVAKELNGTTVAQSMIGFRCP